MANAKKDEQGASIYPRKILSFDEFSKDKNELQDEDPKKIAIKESAGALVPFDKIMSDFHSGKTGAGVDAWPNIGWQGRNLFKDYVEDDNYDALYDAAVQGFNDVQESYLGYVFSKKNERAGINIPTPVFASGWDAWTDNGNGHAIVFFEMKDGKVNIIKTLHEEGAMMYGSNGGKNWLHSNFDVMDMRLD